MSLYSYPASQAAPPYYPSDDSTFLHTQDPAPFPSGHVPSGSDISVTQYSALSLSPVSEWPYVDSFSDSSTSQAYSHHHGTLPYPNTNYIPQTVQTAHVIGPVRSHKSQRTPSKHGDNSSKNRLITPLKTSVTGQQDYKLHREVSLPTILIPQIDSPRDRKNRSGSVYQPITFNQITDNYNAAPHACVGAVLNGNFQLLCAEDKVMRGLTERRIKVGLSWPGYSRYHRAKTIETDHSQATRSQMVSRVARIIFDFFREMEHGGRYLDIDPGYEEWAIFKRRDGTRGIRLEDVAIASLVHRCAAEWHMELRLLNY